MAFPVPEFIPYEHREHLANHWLNTVENWDDEIGDAYKTELTEFAETWDTLSNTERGLLVLACDLIKEGALPAA